MKRNLSILLSLVLLLTILAGCGAHSESYDMGYSQIENGNIRGIHRWIRFPHQRNWFGFRSQPEPKAH